MFLKETSFHFFGLSSRFFDQVRSLRHVFSYMALPDSVNFLRLNDLQ